MFPFLSTLTLFSFLGVIFVHACPQETLKGPDGRCYGFFPYGFNHTKSDYVCKNFYGGHLASIRNAEMDKFVRSMALDLFSGANFWVGGKQEDKGRGWSWTDKSDFVYKNWEQGQEQGGNGYHGLAVNINTGKWHSLPEVTSLPYVCTVYYKKRIPR
uniref:C-type lectin domain-containing protein n=1 Tax=Acrobeloides nanus TaxID=290746 RepID=A0A914DGN9_9BILA